MTSLCLLGHLNNFWKDVLLTESGCSGLPVLVTTERDWERKRNFLFGQIHCQSRVRGLAKLRLMRKEQSVQPPGQAVLEVSGPAAPEAVLPAC